MRNALNEISNISHFTSNLAWSISEYHISERLDPSTRHNMIQLLDESMLDGTAMDSRFTKQTTDAWTQIRASARVTGSTLHNAIILRGLKAQKQHFDEFILKLSRQTHSTDTQIRLDHGIENEKRALATCALVGRILPVFFPLCHYVEEGCYIDFTDRNEILSVVSPDGSIRNVVLDESGIPLERGQAVAAVKLIPFSIRNPSTCTLCSSRVLCLSMFS